MTFVPIRNDNAYIAAGMQSVQGTPVAPDHFFRWLDGSGLEPDLKTEELWEGDGSRNLGQVFKNGQKWKVKLKLAPRPDELAYLEAMAAGTSPDTLTSALVTTTTAGTTANTSTTVPLTSVAGLGSSGTVTMVLEKGTANEEFVVFNLPPSSLTLTVASTYNSGKFLLTHASGVAIQTAANHVIVPKTDGKYSSWEVALGSLSGSAGDTFRLTDCKVSTIKRDGEHGKPLYLELEVIGIACVIQNSPTTVVLENRQIFLYQQASFTLNGSTSGDAKGIDKFSIDQKNMLDDTMQTTAVTLAALVYGNYELKLTASIIMQTWALAKLALLGSTTGTTDAQAIGTGAFIVTFTQADSFHTVTYNIPFMAYVAGKLGAMKKDGKHYELPVEGTATSNAGANANLLTTTINNLTNTAY